MTDFKKNISAGVVGGMCVFGLMLLMGTVFSFTYDRATPVGTDAPSTLDDQDRNTKAAVQERENVDHYWPLTGTQVSDVDSGEHRKVTLHEPLGSDPTAATNKGHLYTKDVSAVVELFWEDESGNVVQLTTGGEIKQSSIEGVVEFNPPGSIVMYGAGSAPTGWLLCNGAAVSRTTFSDLFAIISTLYGVGDGATTFNVPDMRGRIGIGLDAGNVNLAAADVLGETGGEENHTLLTAEMPEHVHSNIRQRNSDTLGALSVAGSSVPNDAQGITGTTGGDGSHNNLQPYNTVNYIIKT